MEVSSDAMKGGRSKHRGNRSTKQAKTAATEPGCLSLLFGCFSLDPAQSNDSAASNPRPSRRKPVAEVPPTPAQAPKLNGEQRPIRSKPDGPSRRRKLVQPPQHEPLYPPPTLNATKGNVRRPSDIFRTDSESYAFLQRLPQQIELRELTQLSMIARNGPTAKDCPGFLYLFWPRPEGAEYEQSPSLVGADIKAATRTFHLARPSTLLDGVPRVMFKIGKALQPRARVSTWASKCREDYELIRQYPDGSEPMPYHGLVEALVKAQLRPRNVLKQCEKCVNQTSGKPVQHREWFAVEVEEGVKGVKSLDEVIRTWMDWVYERYGNEDTKDALPRARC